MNLGKNIYIVLFIIFLSSWRMEIKCLLIIIFLQSVIRHKGWYKMFRDSTHNLK